MLNTRATPAEHRVRDRNARFYGGLWREARFVGPLRFNTWPLVAPLAAASADRLEVAPGLRPRLPLAGTHCIDIIAHALQTLATRGAVVAQGSIEALPYAAARFDLVCALDIVEHVDDDARAFAELARVARPGAVVLLSAPLHAARWNAFDEAVGHVRRYEPAVLVQRLVDVGLVIEHSAIYGMQPRASKLLDLGLWYLQHERARAMWWYNRVFMPIGLRMQAGLDLQPGLINLADVDEVLLVCRRSAQE